MDRLLALLGTAVQFVHTCWDRIVLNGYIDRLQRPENLVYFFQEVVGIACIEPAVLAQRTNTYRAWVQRVADEQGIPVLPAPPKGVRKEDFVQPFYRRGFDNAEWSGLFRNSGEAGASCSSAQEPDGGSGCADDASSEEASGSSAVALAFEQLDPGHRALHWSRRPRQRQAVDDCGVVRLNTMRQAGERSEFACSSVCQPLVRVRCDARSTGGTFAAARNPQFIVIQDLGECIALVRLQLIWWSQAQPAHVHALHSWSTATAAAVWIRRWTRVSPP